MLHPVTWCAREWEWCVKKNQPSCILSLPDAFLTNFKIAPNQAAQLGFSFEYLNGISSPDLVAMSGPGLPAQSIVVASSDDYDFNDLTLENIAFQCGTALRLTPSRARMTGGAWYVEAWVIVAGRTASLIKLSGTMVQVPAEAKCPRGLRGRI